MKTREEWIEGIIKNEIYSCSTDIVEYILRASNEVEDAPFTYDDIEWNSSFNDDLISNLQGKIENLESNEKDEPEQEDNESDEDFDIRWEKWNNAEEERQNEIDELQEKIDKLEDEQSEMPEVYEWWEVASNLADDLYELGEAVIRGWHCYWGRACTGQAISMDYVMQQVYEKHKAILEGA